VRDLQKTLLREDGSIIGLPYEDPEDLARTATASASSTLSRFEVETSDEPWPLEADAGLILPIDPGLDAVEFLLDAVDGTELVVDLYDPVLGQNYVPRELIVTHTVPVAPGKNQWVRVDLSFQPSRAQNAFLLIHANPDVTLHVADRPTPGVLCLTRVPLRPRDEAPQRLREWSDAGLLRRTFCFRSGPTEAFAPSRALDGFQRPHAGPHMWVSDTLPATLELSWPSPVRIGRVDVLADDDVNEDLINLHHHRTPFEVMPTLVRDYRLEVRQDGGWRTASEVRANRRRRNVHDVEPVTTDALRIVVDTSNGTPFAHVVAVRVYE
jgi:hypothetical protein